MNSLTRIVAIIVLWTLGVGCSDGTASKGSKAEKVVHDAAKATADAAKSAAESAKDVVGGVAQNAADAFEEGFATAAKKASSTLEGMEGGSELVKEVTDLFGSAKEAITSITDKASAQAALPKLSDLGGTIDELGGIVGKLPSQAKSAIAGMIESGMNLLKALAEKVMAIPGVQSVIKPKLDELMDKLSSLTH